jgi:hypothetical protein
MIVQGREAGLGCEKDTGCDSLVEPARSLCLDAVNCMRRTQCWTTDVLKGCYCGAAGDTDCLTHPLGVCRQELEAAGKTTDANWVNTHFFGETANGASGIGDVNRPIAFATHLMACDRDWCLSPCQINGAGAANPDAGTGDGGGTGGGQTDAGADATEGAPTEGPPTEMALTSCPDLDLNGTPDCQEDLLLNGTFALDGAAWISEFAAQQAFDSHDASAAIWSGSLAVTNSSVDATDGDWNMTGSNQCVAVSAGGTYVVYAQSFIVTATSGTMAKAGAGLRFFNTANCSGAASGAGYLAPLVVTAASWVTLQGMAMAPTGAQSVAVRLLVQKPYNQAATTARFDNVLFKRR